MMILVIPFLAGCATPFQAPPDVGHIQLDRVDFPIINIHKIWLERDPGILVVRGYVRKQLRVDDTTRTHLDVTLYDDFGEVLRSNVAQFAPSRIPRRPTHAPYLIVLDRLPKDTVRIEVKALEGYH